MVLEKLGESLKNTLSKIAKAIFVDEKLINELVKDIQRALLSADVNVKLVFELSKEIKERALKEKAPSGFEQKEHLVKIVYEELVKFIGGEKSGIDIVKKKPFKIMMVGLLGSGKTTSIGKLARYYQKRGYKVASLGLDIYRPAAIDQIEQISKQVNISSYTLRNEKNPLKIYSKFENEFSKYDILIIDTAGRHALDKQLIDELVNLHKEIKPDENLLVISADVGQAAIDQAKAFHDAGAITGVIITKMDGTAKAGGALSACSVTNAHVKFIGVGEKAEDLEVFSPEGFISRLLGMGDIEALLEKAREVVTEEKAEDINKKFLKGEFNLIDLYDQMEAMSKMGPLNKIMEMIPGMSQVKLPKELLQVQEDKLKRWKFAMSSMTKKELENPDLIDSSRMQRISKGSGVNVSEIRELLKQYKQGKKMMKMFKGGKEEDMGKLMKKFKGKIPKGFGF